MKKILYIICAIFALTACNKEELITPDGQNPDGSYTFNIGIEEPDYVVGSAPKTRAEVKMTRYLLEMYEGNLSATPVKMESTDGVFKVELKKGVDYVCLFWADGGAAAYDATSLKAVKQTDETKTGTAAYCAGVTVNSKTFNGAVTLKRAVAELSFIDKNGLTDASNTLKITYPYASATLNVSDGTVTYAAGTAVRTITSITPPAQATDAFTTDFILAPKEAGKLAELKFQLNTEEEKTIAETAVQANFRTKITGEYQLKPSYKVGDIYPNATAPIGVVFWIDETDASYNSTDKTSAKGKIVGLDEPEANWNGGTNNAGTLTWGPNPSTTNAKDELIGLVNMNAVKTAGSGTFTAYPAFAWVHSKNHADTDYSSSPKGVWYLPAAKELRQLYAAMSGLKWVDSGAVAANGEIDDWGDYKAMPNDTYATARTAFNGLFTAAGKTPMDLSGYYWSSTEGMGNVAYNVTFSSGYTIHLDKDANFKVRAVLAF